MNFNARYSKYVHELPPYVLKRIGKAVEKKYVINETNTYIDEIFAKYFAQYQKKRDYDKNYFRQNKEKMDKLEKDNIILKKMVYKMKLQLDNN